MRDTRYFWAFIIFILINTIISVVYLLIGLSQKKVNRRLLFARSIVMFCAPGVGPLLFLLGWLFFLILFHRKVDLSDVVFSKDRTRELVRTNEEQERNYVPLEEALEVADKEELRNLVLGVAQGNYGGSLSSICLALNSEDTETAHYAASVLQDALNSFRTVVNRSYRNVTTVEEDETEEEKLERIDELQELLKEINDMLLQHVFSDLEEKNYTKMMEELMEIYYRDAPEKITSEQYENMSLRLLDIQQYDACEVWCKRAMDRYPQTLASYTALIKLYFNSGRKEEFFKTLDELKQSTISIDRETLELIRAFQ